MITIIDGKQDGFIGDGFVYVGRAMKTHENPFVKRGSVLGNPFKTRSKFESAKKQVVEKYRVWLREQVATRNPAVCKELERLRAIAERGDLKLACWCSTLCHAEVIRDAIQGAIEHGFHFWSEESVTVGDLVQIQGETMTHTARVMQLDGQYVFVDGETIVGWLTVNRVQVL